MGGPGGGAAGDPFAQMFGGMGGGAGAGGDPFGGMGGFGGQLSEIFPELP